MKFRKPKKECSVCYIFLLTILIKKEKKYIISSPNGDFFTEDLIRFCKWSMESNFCYYSIYSHFSQRSYFKNTQSYLWILLFLAGDIELNPGPLNYQLRHPSLCGYYRAAIYSVFKRIKLIPREDKDGNDIFEQPDFIEDLSDLKNIFGNHYDVQALVWEKLEKIKKKFLEFNTKWGGNRNRNDKWKYYHYFSTSNWVKLDTTTKQKHTLNCEECNLSCHEIHAKFPTRGPTYEKDRNKNILNTVEKAVKSKKMCRGACEELTQNINNTLDNSFTKQFGISFNESFQKCYNLEKKKLPEERKQSKCAIIKENVSKINKDNMSTAVDRVYGSRQSLRGWDADRKNRSFETVPGNKKRTASDKIQVESGIKKAKNHVGNFDSYEIVEQSLEATTSSWTAETHVAWKQLGEQYIKSRDNKLKGNLGQVAKEFLKYKESNGLQFTFKGENENKPSRSRWCLKRFFSRISVPNDIPAKKVRHVK